VQNYRYRLEYNPKNSEELKDFYKKEQKKINKEKKMIDDIINNLIENDELSKEEIEKINKEIETIDKHTKKSSSKLRFRQLSFNKSNVRTHHLL
jgi:TPP-dependent pyruvate/acetoin dehydrogenase alpha subunit